MFRKTTRDQNAPSEPILGAPSTALAHAAQRRDRPQLVALNRKGQRARRSGSTAATPRSRVSGRGWKRGGGGYASVVAPHPEWRGTSVQVCGLWPWASGSGVPTVGAPLGRAIDTGGPLSCDPISYFRAGLIFNPSMFVLGNPGLGKSTMIRHMILGLEGMGVHSLVLGDMRPDYVELVRALGGQVIELGPNRGAINVLDPGESAEVAAKLTGAKRRTVLADAHSRRVTMVTGLLTILQHDSPTVREKAIIERALRVLDDKHTGVPVLTDLLQVIRQAPEPVREMALDRGDDARYREVTDRLESSLLALTGGSELGQMFSAPTSEPIMRDRSVVFDVSSIDQTKKEERAAALLACWSAGFAMVNGAQLLADAGIERRRHYLAVMDELWQVLDSGPGMVERVDALTRLNRKEGAGQVMITHTMSDLERMPLEEDRSKARGFVERSDIVLLGGLSHQELDRVEKVLPLSRKERERIVSWTSPGSYDAKTRKRTNPPGMGHFLMKMSGRPGIAGRVELTSTEKRLQLHNTSRRWIDG